MAQIKIIETICDNCSKSTRESDLAVETHTLVLDKKSPTSVDLCHKCFDKITVKAFLTLGRANARSAGQQARHAA